MVVSKDVGQEEPSTGGGVGETAPKVRSEYVDVVWADGTMRPRSVESGIYTYRAGQMVVAGAGLDQDKRAELDVEEGSALIGLDDQPIVTRYETDKLAERNKGPHVPGIVDRLSGDGGRVALHHVCGITPYYMISEGDPDPVDEAAFDSYRQTVRDTVQQVFEEATGPPSDEYRPRIGIIDTGYLVGTESIEKEIELTDQGIVDDADVKQAIVGSAPRSEHQLMERAEGHAVFVAGVVAHTCLRATLRFEKVQSTDGVVDEATVCQQIVDAVKVTDGNSAPVDIINLSLGCYARGDEPPLLLQDTLSHVLAEQPGLVIVAAAGNDGSKRSFFPAGLTGEGFERLISVGGQRDGRRAGYSNHGDWVDWYGPGVDVVSRYLGSEDQPVKRKNLGDGTIVSFRGFARWEGTSFAAPHVSGLIARMMSCHASSGNGGPLTAADAWMELRRWAPELRHRLGLFRADEL